jgi:hypothetical protein
MHNMHRNAKTRVDTRLKLLSCENLNSFLNREVNHNPKASRHLENLSIVMLKAKKRHILHVLICKSIFDITFTYSDISSKCSHVVEIEKLKIFEIKN